MRGNQHWCFPFSPQEILRCAQDDDQGFVILNATKDLERAFVQQTRLTWLCGLLWNHQNQPGNAPKI